MQKLDKAVDLIEAGEPDEGMRICSDELTKDPDNAMALFVAAYACMKAERNGIAYIYLKRAVEILPDKESIWNNLGMACVGMQRLEEAERCLRKALELRPGFKAALNNLALLSVYDCQPDLALKYAKQSLAQDENQWDVAETKAYAHMMLGQWKEGWEGYEKMIGHSKHRKWKPTKPDIPAWNLETGVIHIRGEQGVGDEISYASILPSVKGHKVILECDRKLEGLFKRSFPEFEVYGTRFENHRPWDNRKIDYHLLIGSLGKFFRLKNEDFPREAFLKPDPERCLQWRALLDTLPGKKIGIAWTGGLANTFRGRRSLDLEALLPILSVPGISWVSLQYQDPTEELEQFENKHGIKIHHWKRGPESKDYDDVAGLVNELDMVISVCTAVVHLSGALGKECHVLVPSKPRWWYGLSGKDSVWYKSLVFWRQKGKDWNSVIHQVKDMLQGRK